MAIHTNAISANQDKTLRLLDAQNKALALFTEIERTLLRSGVSEKHLSKEIHELGKARFGIETVWHKEVMRSGPNTLKPHKESLTDRVIKKDDILSVDLGPIFEAWEPDFGRTYVLGNDAAKVKLRDSLHVVWHRVKDAFWENSNITAAELHAIAKLEAEQAGYTLGGEMAEHLLGQFSHERILRDKVTLFIRPENKERMTKKGRDGLQCH
jgi:Xaa-Pro aminopeptidase